MGWINIILGATADRLPWVLVVLLAITVAQMARSLWFSVLSGKLVTGVRHTEAVNELKRQLEEQTRDYTARIEDASARVAASQAAHDRVLDLLLRESHLTLEAVRAMEKAVGRDK